VREAQAQGEIRADLASTEVVHTLTGAYLAVFFDHLAHAQADSAPHTTVDRIITMILSGIAGPKG
jgi:hypothetical protein